MTDGDGETTASEAGSVTGSEGTIVIEPSERFLDAAREWGDRRLLDDEEAFRAKAEQALLEVEHLVAGSTSVAFEVEGERIRYDPTDDAATFLTEQAEETGIDRETVLELYVNLFSRVFLEE